MAAAAQDPSSDWLYGPLPDLLLGCGLLFVLVSVVFGVAGPGSFESVPLAIPALLIALVSAPHYGATILRVYEHRADRRAYFLFSVVATVLLLIVAGMALFRPWLGSVLATVYLSWSSWHYTGQNYGIAVMFLRRRGVDLDRTSQRILHGSFVLSFLLVLLVIHGFVGGVADPAVKVRLMPLGIPDPINDLLLPGLLFAYLGLTLVWVVRLAGRAATVAAIAPAMVIAVVQALWWSVPYLGKYFGLESEWVALQWTDRQDFFPWIASAHAAQYLWITSFYARASPDWHGQTRYYLGALAAGSAIWALPAFLFAPAAGELDWNFALLLGATVNIHHFILDGAIWKLRHMKIASVLIGSAVRGDEEVGARGWVRPLVWSIAALGLVMALHSVAERYLIEPAARQRGDIVAVADSLDRQAWHGRGSALARFKLGRAFMQAGDRAAAMAQFELSAGMEPRVESIKRLIAHYHRSRNRYDFVRSCDRLFELDHVPRPMATLDVGIASQAEFKRFSDACIEVAQAARPLTREALAAADATGGGGVDGSVRRRDAD